MRVLLCNQGGCFQLCQGPNHREGKLIHSPPSQSTPNKNTARQIVNERYWYDRGKSLWHLALMLFVGDFDVSTQAIDGAIESLLFFVLLAES